LERIPITREGLEALREELTKLKAVERPKNIQAIEEARAHGDITENSEFEAAKERQAFLEARIGELEYKIAAANVIDTGNLPKDRVVFGSSVLLENMDTGEEVRYTIVGTDESDIGSGRISLDSPLGKALLGKAVDAEVSLKAPGGLRRYVLVEIQ